MGATSLVKVTFDGEADYAPSANATVTTLKMTALTLMTTSCFATRFSRDKSEVKELQQSRSFNPGASTLRDFPLKSNIDPRGVRSVSIPAQSES
jgi:hypothetical protein